MATDVEYWLADECVLAYRGHEPLIEQAGRLLRRHRSWTVSVGSSLIAFAILATIAAYLVNQYRLNEQQAKKSAQEFKQDAVNRYKIAKEAMDTLVLGSSESLSDFPAMKDLQQRFLQKAADGFSELSKNASPDSALEIERVRAIVRLADTLHVQEKIQEAHAQYQTALSVLDSLPEGASSTVRSGLPSLSDFDRQLELGRIYSRLGLVYENEGKADQAKSEFDRAIRIFRSMELKNPDSEIVKGNLAIALSNFGSLQERQKNSSEAIALLSASLPLFDAAIAVDESRYSLAAVRSRESLARVLRDTGKTSQSRDCLGEAQSMLKNLVQTDPDNPDYLEAIAGTFVTLANLEHSQGEQIRSLRALGEAESVYRHLIKNWPNSLKYLENLFLVVVDQGIANLAQGEIDLATEQFDQAAEQFFDLSSRYPDVKRFQFRLAAAFNGVGQSKSEKKDGVEDATRAFVDCIKYCNNHANGSPDFERLAIGSKLHFANLLHSQADYVGARTLSDDVIPTLESTLAQNSDQIELHYQLAHAYWRRGLLEFDEQQVELAQRYFKKSIRQWEGVVDREFGPVPMYELALCFLRCPDENQNDYPLAERYLKICCDKVSENHSFATAYAEAAIRNNNPVLCSEVLKKIEENYGGWNALDHLVNAKYLLSEKKANEASQAIENAKQWAMKNRPMNLDIQRQIKRVVSEDTADQSQR
jgi:tetratricopeptide (TPR) repeat protein